MYSCILLFDVIVNEIDFLVSLSNSSLMYKNATDFWIVILHIASLLNSFISSNSFLKRSVEFSLYIVLSHWQIMTVLLLPFQFRSLLFLFLVWFMWLGPPVLSWIEVVKVDNVFLFLILRNTLLGLPVEYDVSSGFVIYGLHYVEVCFHFAENVLIINWCGLQSAGSMCCDCDEQIHTDYRSPEEKKGLHGLSLS